MKSNNGSAVYVGPFLVWKFYSSTRSIFVLSSNVEQKILRGLCFGWSLELPHKNNFTKQPASVEHRCVPLHG